MPLWKKLAAILGGAFLVVALAVARVEYLSTFSPEPPAEANYAAEIYQYCFESFKTLLLFICAIVYQIVVMIITMAVPAIGLVFSLLSLGFLVLWIMGLIAAINGEEKPMPLIGEKAQELFKGI